MFNLMAQGAAMLSQPDVIIALIAGTLGGMFIGAMPGLKAFVAAVFGGIGSIPGAVLGAYIIGICESLIKANDSIAIFSNAFTFALLILVLLFKPNGMFGEKLTEKV